VKRPARIKAIKPGKNTHCQTKLMKAFRIGIP